ncbi:MAG TPA: aminoglycoside 6-adenylyltransferase [Thermomicrobiales bacterium]|jgi:hypothetical protein|nr:aminoglycoside 6-adenylyltransferase [Thermomicrobiales bacterium]
MTQPHDTVIEYLQHWAAERDDVHAVILTSTRAVPGARVDALSDYDIILVVNDVRNWAEDRSWVKAFGEELVSWWDPVGPSDDLGVATGGSIVYFADGLKIDFSLWPSAAITGMVERRALIPELDAGYRVLHDRDGITAPLPSPSFAAYRLEPPDSATWTDTVTGFLVGAPYVAKSLVRGDLLPARWCLDVDMIHTYLVPMLRGTSERNRGGPVSPATSARASSARCQRTHGLRWSHSGTGHMRKRCAGR